MSEEQKKGWKRHLDVDILPIFVITKTTPAKIISNEGTGFLIAPNLLITCWHCVRNPVEENQTYAVNREQKAELFPLFNIQQDGNNTDLATANVAMLPESELILAERDVYEGTDVHSFGYPLMNFELNEETGEKFPAIDFRLLKGYITRNFWRDDPTFGRGYAYELDMPTPEGLSGSPLFKAGSREVLGVVFGYNDVALIEYLGQFDHETGKREPDVQKIYHFGLAHNTETLKSLTTNATRNLPLHEYLKEDFSKRKDSYHYYIKGRLLLENSDFDVSCECGFTNKIKFPYDKLHCDWCASHFEFTGVGDGIALVSKDGVMHKVIGTDNEFATVDDGNLGFILEEEQVENPKQMKIINFYGEEINPNPNLPGPYYFPIKSGLVGKEDEIVLTCMCGCENKWVYPHNESDLKCSNCLAGFRLMELEGEGKYIQADGKRVKIIGS